MVDLPLAERPVNHSVKPFWPRSVLRSWCDTEDGCHVIFLAAREGQLGCLVDSGRTGHTHVAIVRFEVRLRKMKFRCCFSLLKNIAPYPSTVPY